MLASGRLLLVILPCIGTLESSRLDPKLQAMRLQLSPSLGVYDQMPAIFERIEEMHV